MGSFKFALGAGVMLATSMAAVEAKKRNEERLGDQSAMQKSGLMGGVATLLEYAGPVESGIVIGRAEYTSSANSYLVRYRAGDGRQAEEWWDEDAIVKDPEALVFSDGESVAGLEPRRDEGDAVVASTSLSAAAEIRVFRYAQDGGVTTDITIPLL